jgi:hypothetical protein
VRNAGADFGIEARQQCRAFLFEATSRYSGPARKMLASRNDDGQLTDVERSPDEAKRNPGSVLVCAPDFAALHPGYDASISRFAKIAVDYDATPTPISRQNSFADVAMHR